MKPFRNRKKTKRTIGKKENTQRSKTAKNTKTKETIDRLQKKFQTDNSTDLGAHLKDI